MKIHMPHEMPESELFFHIQASSEIFFTDSHSYTGFDLTSEGRRYNACEEPRNEVRERGKPIPTAIQTAGGGGGEGFDRAITQTVMTGDLMPWAEGTRQEKTLRGNIAMGGHLNVCKFIDGIVLVENEIITPSDFTREDYERTWRMYDIEEDMTPVLPKVQDAVKRQQEHTAKHGTSDVLNIIDPEHLKEVEGSNLAGIYVTNHHPHLGLDRDKKARLSDEEGAFPLQGYHQSRRAAYLDLYNSYSRRDVRTVRMCALLARLSAVRTVLGQLREDTKFYEAVPGPHGLVIFQQEGL